MFLIKLLEKFSNSKIIPETSRPLLRHSLTVSAAAPRATFNTRHTATETPLGRGADGKARRRNFKRGIYSTLAYSVWNGELGG